jgi:allantoin racemase
MKLLYINPNATEAMTHSIVKVAQAAAPSALVVGWTNFDGPPAIQGPEDGAAAVPGILAMLPAAQDLGADAIVIACFDDTGLAQVRAAAHCPVLGIGQSAYVTAGLLGHRFSVITTLQVSVPVIEGNIAAMGAAGGCASVRASGIPVLDVEEGSEATRAHLAEEIEAARTQDGATAAVLGCAGMAGLRQDLSTRTDLPLIDGVAASALLAQAMAQLPRI